MASLRPFQRVQSLLRGFFGLGPDQFDLLDTILPVIDVDLLLQPTSEVILVQGNVAALVPGTGATITLSPPSAGTWLLDSWGLDSSGPATSGAFTYWGYRSFNTVVHGGQNANLGFLPSSQVVNKLGVMTQVLGQPLAKPLLLSRLANGVSDSISFGIFNGAASVGNMSANAYIALRLALGGVNE